MSAEEEPLEDKPQEESKPDPIVWGMLVLVILGSLAWFTLAGRRVGPTGVAVQPPGPSGVPTQLPSPVRPGLPPPDLSIPENKDVALPNEGLTEDTLDAAMLYVGAEPTADPRTWAYVHGDLLLGALKELDGTPATALTPQQFKSLADLLNAVEKPSTELVKAARELVLTAQEVLEPRQMAGMTAEEETIARGTPDIDALVASLKKLAASAPPAKVPATRGQATQAVYPALFIVAGLGYLENFKRAPLEPRQAARLLPVVSRFAQKLNAQVALYQRLLAILNEKQVQAYVAILADMRVRRIPPLDERKVTLAEMQAYVYRRMAR